jgi:hypothetical protein
MQQGPSWEAKRSSANQEISRILRNVNLQHQIHNVQPPVPILSQINIVHTPSPQIQLLEDQFRRKTPHK